MFIEENVILCLGQTIRQALKFSLSQSHNPTISRLQSSMTSLPGSSAVLENVILQLLDMFCDPDTSTHAQRLVTLTEATGRHLGLPLSDIAILRQAALLHDIGKIAIPAPILHKPGALTPDERAIIHLHPIIGQDILLSSGTLFAQLAPIIVAHHEYWDGSGYPLGLSGSEIPLLARIISVVDSYDAMTSRRSYGHQFSHTEACLELQRCAGQQYDPHVVAAFLHVHGDPLTQEHDQTIQQSIKPRVHARWPDSLSVISASGRAISYSA